MCIIIIIIIIVIIIIIIIIIIIRNTFPVFLMCSLFFTFRTVDILNQRKQVEVH